MTLGHRSYEGTPPHAWTTARLTEWLATADGGRFAQVALPPDIDGAALLAMPARALRPRRVELRRGARRRRRMVRERAGKVATALFQALRTQSGRPLRGGKADAAATARRMRAASARRGGGDRGSRGGGGIGAHRLAGADAGGGRDGGAGGGGGGGGVGGRR